MKRDALKNEHLYICSKEAPVAPDDHVVKALPEAYDNRGCQSPDEVVMESTPVKNIVALDNDQGQIVEPDFGHYEHLHPLSEEQRFKAEAADGLEPFMTIMSYMAVNQTYNALSVICRGNNWRKVAFALATVFHSGEDIALNVMKAKGYDRLRDLVTTCVVDLRRENRDLPRDCSRLVHRLFWSRGITPQFAV